VAVLLRYGRLANDLQRIDEVTEGFYFAAIEELRGARGQKGAARHGRWCLWLSKPVRKLDFFAREGNCCWKFPGAASVREETHYSWTTNRAKSGKSDLDSLARRVPGNHDTACQECPPRCPSRTHAAKHLPVCSCEDFTNKVALTGPVTSKSCAKVEWRSIQ
jgi:hypothetical protein